MCKVWAHTNISSKRKLDVFNACVISKLMYCLDTEWLNEAERRKLDAFHARSLRQIAGIKASYYSRISNGVVRGVFGVTKLSHTLLHHQLKLLGKIARQDDSNILRRIVFEDGSIDLRPLSSKRRRGRPRKAWAPELYAIAKRIAVTSQNLKNLWANSATAREGWNRAVLQYCANLA